MCMQRDIMIHDKIYGYAVQCVIDGELVTTGYHYFCDFPNISKEAAFQKTCQLAKEFSGIPVVLGVLSEKELLN